MPKRPPSMSPIANPRVPLTLKPMMAPTAAQNEIPKNLYIAFIFFLGLLWFLLNIKYELYQNTAL